MEVAAELALAHHQASVVLAALGLVAEDQTPVRQTTGLVASVASAVAVAVVEWVAVTLRTTAKADKAVLVVVVAVSLM